MRFVCKCIKFFSQLSKCSPYDSDILIWFGFIWLSLVYLFYTALVQFLKFIQRSSDN